jgi:hypothetical protein
VTTTKVNYDASTAATITLNSLTTSATVGRQSAVIDNTSKLYTNAKLTVNVTTANLTIGSSKACYVYFFGTEDGTNFDQDDAATGSGDSAYTINTATNLHGPYVINTPTQNKKYTAIIPVEAFFGGVLPKKWGFVVCNDTNQTLASSGNSASYSGGYYTNT